MNLNGTEEDRLAYKEKIKQELARSGAENQLQESSEQASNYTYNNFGNRLNKRMAGGHDSETEKDDTEHGTSVHEDNDLDN